MGGKVEGGRTHRIVSTISTASSQVSCMDENESGERVNQTEREREKEYRE